MGGQESICQGEVQGLQIPTTVEQGLQMNLKTFKQHVPKRGYARKSSARPNLSERVQQTIKYLLQSQSLKPQNQEGYEFPCFLILKKKVYYLGQWIDGLPHGKGRVYFPNGCFFQGWFNMGEAQGDDNIFIYTDGSFYRGGFKHSLKSGFGKFCYHNGFQYKGTWIENKPQGRDCIQTYPDGSRYIGEFSNGVKQGKGQYWWSDGKMYSGNWKNGYMEGRGILKKGKDSYFEGDFIQNQKQGRGILKTPYGRYQGKFTKGQMGGEGVFRWNDGRIYKGFFQNGKMHGEGVLTFNNGRIIVGQWQNGQNIQVFQVSNNNKNIN